MRACLPLGLVFVLLASCAAPTQSPPGAPDRSRAAAELIDDRELIVLTEPPAEPMIAAALALGYELRAVYPLPRLDDDLVSFTIPPGRTIPEAIDEIEVAAPGVTAGAHHLYRLQTIDGAATDRFYANSLIGWPPEGCPAVRSIGMIDAGVPETHPGLSDGRVVQQRFVPGDAAPASDHGTLMASLLIGPGRLSEGTLYSANVVDPARNGGDEAGVVPPLYPAAFPFVLAVTAVDQSLDIYDGAVHGAQIDVAAPGVDILLEDAGRLRVLSGTSAAVPFVTAAIAADPELDTLEVASVRARLAAAARDLGAAGMDPVFGAGLIVAPEPCRAD